MATGEKTPDYMRCTTASAVIPAVYAIAATNVQLVTCRFPLFRVLCTSRVSSFRSMERCRQMRWACRCGWHRFSHSTSRRSTPSCSPGARGSGCKPASGAQRRWRRWPGRRQDEKRKAPSGTLPLHRPLHHHRHRRHSRQRRRGWPKTGTWMQQHQQQAVVHRRRPRRPKLACL